ncbi:ATP-grasp domain-containing protein [Erysipelotrichaceae bacterium OttesenSCG-928-M19]|nr:ATP-grasp domain-containing protein [Erysipelotrichaceae bacterium OttesenSCG-928-M19]
MIIIKAIVIGATNDILYGCKLLKEHNIDYYIVDGAQDAPGFKYGNNHAVIDISNEKEVIKYATENNINFVLPVPIGRYITTWAAVNEKLGLKGLSSQAALLCTDKWLFHKTLNDNGLRNANAFLINKDFNLTQLDKIKLPQILKPRFGSGSRGVVQIDNIEKLYECISNVIEENEDYILEDAIPGVEFGVDAMILDGNFNLVLLREKKLTPLPNRQAIAYYSKYDENKYHGLLEKATKKVKAIVKQLGINNSIMHADLMVNDKDIFMIEISARPSGHNMHNNFTIKATDYDMLDNYIRYQMGEDITFDEIKVKNVCMHYFDFENVLFKKVPTESEIMEIKGVLQFKCNIKVNDSRRIISQGSDLINDGFVIIQANNREEFDKIINQVKACFEVEAI